MSLLPPLLRLPAELRENIYTHLVTDSDVSSPLPSVGFASVSHHPPSLSSLLIHPLISAELLHYFYRISRWKIVLASSFNFYRVDPNLLLLESSSCLKHIRTVELVFFFDQRMLQDYPSFGLEALCVELQRRAERACTVLGGPAPARLRSVVVNWCDSTVATDESGWRMKAGVLAPLRELQTLRRARGRCEVEVRLGQVTGPPGLRRAEVLEAVRDIVGEVIDEGESPNT